MKKIALGLLAFILLTTNVYAVTCTWQGGAGIWNNSNTASWSCGHVPVAADAVVFDGTSGSGTVTVNSPNGAGVVTVTSITMGTFVGTLDFSANNNNVTLSTFSNTGSAIRTLNMGNGTWTITNNGAAGTVWNMNIVSNLTFNANSSTLVFTATGVLTRTFTPGSQTYSTVTVSANASGGVFFINNGGANTFGTFNVTAPNAIQLNTVPLTITNPYNFVGSSSNPLYIFSNTPGTLASFIVASGSPTMSWVGIRDMQFQGGATFTATNSLNLGNNTGITITPPGSGSGGGCILGGWLLWRDFDPANDNVPAFLDRLDRAG